MYALMSSVIHELIEAQAGGPEGDTFAHVRFEAPIPDEAPEWAKETLSGEIDLAEKDEDEWTLFDFKSVFTTARGTAKPEYIAQLNMLAYLTANHHHRFLQQFRPAKLTLVHLFRDWRAVRADEDPNYPQQPWETIEVPVWPEDVTISTILHNVERHRKARKATLDATPMPPCTEEEKWASTTKFLAFKERNKIHRTFDSPSEAQQYISERKPKDQPAYSIVERPGKPIRCLYFCEAAPFCNQHQAYLASQP